MAFVRKNRQEALLRESILSSQLVDEVFLDYVAARYQNNPYHNFTHALKVAQLTLSLPLGPLSIEEIVSLLVAALFHDALHEGKTQPLDEVKAIYAAQSAFVDLPKEHLPVLTNMEIVRKAILGTIFPRRNQNTNRYAKILADFDIGVVGESLPIFLYYSMSAAQEFEDSPTEFLTTREKGYFKFLLKINPNIFFSAEAQVLLPNGLQVIADYVRLPLPKKLEMFHCLETQDITLEEFEALYFPSEIKHV